MAKIKVKSLASLMDNGDSTTIDDLSITKSCMTPPKKPNRRKPPTPSASTTKGKKLKEKQTEDVIVNTNKKQTARSSKKEPPPNQLRIDTYFKSASKTFQIPVASTNSLMQSTMKTTGKENNERNKLKRPNRTIGRKRLFQDDDDEEKSIGDIISYRSSDDFEPAKSKSTKRPISKKQVQTRSQLKEQKPVEIIDLCLISDDEDLERNAKSKSVTPANQRKANKVHIISPEVKLKKSDIETRSKRRTIAAAVTPAKPKLITAATIADVLATTSKRKPRPLPPYKIVCGTTFAVDAFQFGAIEGVTHYFLSHYHADHYIGLTRKFSMPLYASRITANLIRTFIPIDEQYLHELELNTPVVINDVEVTALDANHCPGAVIIVFKLPSGKCILHTGDFRASPDMESEPIFWNNDIHTIYLDTTYISDKYDFCTQYESIQKGIELVSEFRKKHLGKRILYICGSYVIGKEKFWHAIAEEFEITKVWTEANRRKALLAMDIPEFQELLCDNPYEAEMHVISMMKLSYKSLVEYFEPFQNDFDVLFAMRPSGWEKNSKPQYRGKINLVGIEYSEHSSHNEMQRFVMYLKPKEVISTVPYSHNLMQCPKVPEQWYKYDRLTGNQKNFQTSITSFLKLNKNKSGGCPERKSKARKAILFRTNNDQSGGDAEKMQVSPYKSPPIDFIGSMCFESGYHFNLDEADALYEPSSKPVSVEDEPISDENDQLVYNAALAEADADDDWLQ